MSSRSLNTLWAVVVVLGALLLAAPPLSAQSSDAAANMRSSDFNNKSQDMGSMGNQAYTNAQGYIERIRNLETRQKNGEELSARDQKKLTKAYEKAINNLETAIEESPDWQEPRLTLGALQYNRGDYAAAHEAFDGLLGLDPDHQAAQDFLAMCEEQLAAQEKQEDEEGASR